MGRKKRRQHVKENAREALFCVLKAIEGPFTGNLLQVPEWKTVTIKRSEASLTPIFHRKLGEICLPDPDVSRLHAKICFKGGKFEVVDVGSLNGTFVNGKRLSFERTPSDSPHVLECGDKLVVGQTTFEILIYKRFVSLSEELEYEQGQGLSSESVQHVKRHERAGIVPKRQIRVAHLSSSQREALQKRLDSEQDNSPERNVFVDGLIPNKNTVSRTILSVLAYNRRLDDVQNGRDNESLRSSGSSIEHEDSSIDSNILDEYSSYKSSSDKEMDDWRAIQRTAGKKLKSSLGSSRVYQSARNASRLRLKRHTVDDGSSNEEPNEKT
eukprot:jgi/Galph1/6079/GphlegSOOS_G4717.1